MDILIIGGGVFVGRAIVEAALTRGHRVTAFSRGNSPLPQADRVESVVGDRNGDLGSLQGRRWDAVIDTCAYRPEEVTSLHATIGGNTTHYTLISSISAYGEPAKVGLDESSALAKPLRNPGPGITAENYGPLKAEAEQAAGAFKNALIIRPGIIAGPFDPTDRFTYWVDLISRRTDLLVPAVLPESPVQIIDGRDLAAWLIACIEAGATGAFNAVGPENPITMADLLTAVAQGLGRTVNLHSKSNAELAAMGANVENGFPLFLPIASPQGGLFQANGQKACTSGLRHRAISETARDTVDWFHQSGRANPKVGWTAEKMAAAFSPKT